MNTHSNLAIIPARWGSKGIPYKNLAILNGKPLISFTIEAALQSGRFDTICLISDSEEIRQIAASYGIDSIEEPEILASDDSKMIDVVNFAINHYKEKWTEYEMLTLLQPTSPLRTWKHIRDAIDAYYQNNTIGSLVSFQEAQDHPFKYFLLSKGNALKPVSENEFASMPRQLLPKALRQNGAIYISRTKDLQRLGTFFTKPTHPFMMEPSVSIDIDTETDLRFAEFCMKKSMKEARSEASIADYDCSSFVFIIGGAFQGKSLLSMKIAERYSFSAVLGTDVLRNILRVREPNEDILRSTSKLDRPSFNGQRNEVSKLLYQILGAYSERQEKLVIEGIHFSRDFLQFAIRNWAKCFFLENQLPWKEKVKLKRITTPITRVINPSTNVERLAFHSENLDPETIVYTHRANEYWEIHELLSQDAVSLGVTKIVFWNLNEGFVEICKQLNDQF